MTARQTRKRVPYTAEEMFDLVAEIERYPDFLPWCAALRIVSRQERKAQEILLADMVVSYSVFRDQFRSRVTLAKPVMTIDTDYVHGPFRELKNHWRFSENQDGGSVVEFKIEFEFRNPVLQATAHSVFEQVFLRMADAFVARAEEVYGRRG